jgi:putative transposase
MSRYRLEPTPEQEWILLRHCSDARYVWNLCVEQQAHWRPGRRSAPGFGEQCRQLTEARADTLWLAEGSVTVQQQAIRDFDLAMRSFFRGTHRKPTWRKAGRNEGFRIIAVKPEHVRLLNRSAAMVFVPKCGWLRLRLSRPVPAGVRSYRVTLDRAGRWHIAFAAIPRAIDGPDIGEIVGIDMGVAASAALSTGELLVAPRLSLGRQFRLLVLQRSLARAKKGSNRRRHVRAAIACMRAREADARKDWCEKLSTDLARRFDVIRVEDLNIPNMTRTARGIVAEPGRNVAAKAGLNREIGRSGWGLLIRRLEEKAPGRVQKINPAYTSQRCSACGRVDRKSRESQAGFRCTACGFACNADVNAASNIAAGHAVNARGGDRTAEPVNREPQRSLLVA